MSLLQHRRAVSALFLSVCALLIAAAAPAPVRAPGRVEGFVRDQAGAPVTGAQVFVIGTGRAASTDAQGHYLISGLPAGAVDLRAGFVGYRQLIIRGVPVVAGQTTRRDFVLEAATISVEAGDQGRALPHRPAPRRPDRTGARHPARCRRGER